MPRRPSMPSEPARHQVGMACGGRGGVHAHDAGSPASSVHFWKSASSASVAPRRRRRRPGRRSPRSRPITAQSPSTVQPPLRSGRRRRRSPAGWRGRPRPAGVGDLDDQDRATGTRPAGVDGGDRRPVAQPRLDVRPRSRGPSQLADFVISSKSRSRRSSSVSRSILSAKAGNLLSVRIASIFCPPLGSRSTLT